MALNINGTTGISGVDGSASAPAVQGSDSNTGVSFGTDTVNINTGGTTRATVTSNGRLSLTQNVIFPSKDAYIYSYNGGSDGQVRSGFELSGTNQTIRYFTATNERMRIDSSGNTMIGCTNTDSNNSTGVRLFNNGAIHATRSSEYSYVGRRSDNDGGLFLFRRDSSNVGSISVNSSSTAYNTSSDYRLKENQTAITDGITRLKTLKPYRFNWKVDPDTKVDGFFAHEVTAVPEAISGTKDAVATEDSEEAKKGDPIYQQIDQSKLVPLLTAALQEAVAKIEVLETKVAALEAT